MNNSISAHPHCPTNKNHNKTVQVGVCVNYIRYDAWTTVPCVIRHLTSSVPSRPIRPPPRQSPESPVNLRRLRGDRRPGRVTFPAAGAVFRSARRGALLMSPGAGCRAPHCTTPRTGVRPAGGGYSPRRLTCRRAPGGPAKTSSGRAWLGSWERRASGCLHTVSACGRSGYLCLP